MVDQLQDPRHPIDRLLAIMAKLRDPKTGCPWDVAQDFATIAPYTIEEAYEVADAIAQGDMEALREELGDLLLQVVFHSRMAEEAGLFNFSAVAAGLNDKLVRRHPHVFGDKTGQSEEDIHHTWEATKASERAEKSAKKGNKHQPSLLDGIALSLPALVRAEKLQNRAARVGFDWPSPLQVLDKIEEEIAELRAALSEKDNHLAVEEEFGDLMFAMVNLGRWLSIDSESALSNCNIKFINRFKYIEQHIDLSENNMNKPSLAEMEALWIEAKNIYKKQ